jgi:hypothetical protein
MDSNPAIAGVHLNPSLEEALAAGKGDPAPAVVVVDAKAAHVEGFASFLPGHCFGGERAATVRIAALTCSAKSGHASEYVMNRVIGAQHEFHDAQYARDWAERFDPTPERLMLFDIMIMQLKMHLLPAPHVVELGIGPGYLASRLLAAMPGVTYEAIDFSQPMLELASSRLQNFPVESASPRRI